jgi:hypothetical protein
MFRLLLYFIFSDYFTSFSDYFTSSSDYFTSSSDTFYTFIHSGF